MNANALQRGHDYAYLFRARRNVQYVSGAKRCKVLFIYQLESPYKRKRISLVEVQKLNDDGTPNEAYPYPCTIEARQIYATWDEHVIEQERHEERQRKHKEEQDRYYAEVRERQRKRDEEYRKVAEERRRIEAERRQRIEAALSFAGIPLNNVTVGYDGIRIHIPTWDIERVISDIENIIQTRDSGSVDEGCDQTESQTGELANGTGSEDRLRSSEQEEENSNSF